MRVLIQRVKNSSVSIKGTCVGKIKQGLLLFVGFENDDCHDDIVWIAKKIVQLRVFEDVSGVMNLSISDLNASRSYNKPGIMVISQFTLYASTKKGNRPSFLRAAAPNIAIPLYEAFIIEITSLFHGCVETGQFGAEMEVELINDGPVTLWIDSKNKE